MNFNKQDIFYRKVYMLQRTQCFLSNVNQAYLVCLMLKIGFQEMSKLYCSPCMCSTYAFKSMA